MIMHSIWNSLKYNLAGGHGMRLLCSFEDFTKQKISCSSCKKTKRDKALILVPKNKNSYACLFKQLCLCIAC
jgi:hypothetical protein